MSGWEMKIKINYNQRDEGNNPFPQNALFSLCIPNSQTISSSCRIKWTWAFIRPLYFIIIRRLIYMFYSDCHIRHTSSLITLIVSNWWVLSQFMRISHIHLYQQYHNLIECNSETALVVIWRKSDIPICSPMCQFTIFALYKSMNGFQWMWEFFW